MLPVRDVPGVFVSCILVSLSFLTGLFSVSSHIETLKIQIIMFSGIVEEAAKVVAIEKIKATFILRWNVRL